MQNTVLIKEINLLNDCLFKAVMTSPNNREMVVDVLHALTNIRKEDLYNATYIGGEELTKRKTSQKKQTTDLTIMIQKNHQIVVEMNQYYTKDIFNKNVEYNLSKIVENTKKNREYPKMILINIDNFNKFKTSKPILEFKIRDEFGHVETNLYKSLHLILENVGNTKYNVDKEIKKFTKFLKQKTNIKELESEFKGDEKYMAAIRTVEDLTTDPEFSGYYDLEEAHKQELESMKETSLEEGIAQGKKQNSIEVAKKMLKIPTISMEQIIECTDLSKEEVEELKQDV